MALTLIVTIAMIGTWRATAQESDWKKLPDMPVERWEAATVVLEDKLYILGGYTDGTLSSKILNVFDPKDGSRTRLQDLPSSITHFNAVLDGRTIWFAGGFKDGYKGHAIAEVWNYDLDKDRYTAAPLLPAPRGGGGLALVGRKLHFISGIKADRITDADDHWVLDLDDWEKGSAQWKNLAPIPVGRNQFATKVLGGKIYAMGGQFGHDNGQDNQELVHIYDPETDTWSDGPELPSGHSHAEGGTFISGDRIYMVGGHTTAKDGSGKRGRDQNVIALTPGGQWEVVATLPMPLSSPAAAIIGGKIYVAGGQPRGGVILADMWVRDAP